MEKTILTGLKPTGSLTLGNYIGSISQMVKMQDEYKSYLFVADMHAITVPNDSSELHKNIRDYSNCSCYYNYRYYFHLTELMNKNGFFLFD